MLRSSRFLSALAKATARVSKPQPKTPSTPTPAKATATAPTKRKPQKQKQEQAHTQTQQARTQTRPIAPSPQNLRRLEELQQSIAQTSRLYGRTSKQTVELVGQGLKERWVLDAVAESSGLIGSTSQRMMDSTADVLQSRYSHRLVINSIVELSTRSEWNTQRKLIESVFVALLDPAVDVWSDADSYGTRAGRNHQQAIGRLSHALQREPEQKHALVVRIHPNHSTIALPHILKLLPLPAAVHPIVPFLNLTAATTTATNDPLVTKNTSTNTKRGPKNASKQRDIKTSNVGVVFGAGGKPLSSVVDVSPLSMEDSVRIFSERPRRTLRDVLEQVAFDGLQTALANDIEAVNASITRGNPSSGKAPFVLDATLPLRLTTVRSGSEVVVVCGSKSMLEGPITNTIDQHYSRLGLRLDHANMQVTSLASEESFIFLHFTFQYRRRWRGGNRIFSTAVHEPRLAVFPDVTALRDVLRAVKVESKNLNKSALDIVKSFNRILRPWFRYFAISNCQSTFRVADHLIHAACWRWATKKHPRQGKTEIANMYFLSPHAPVRKVEQKPRKWNFFAQPDGTNKEQLLHIDLGTRDFPVVSANSLLLPGFLRACSFYLKPKEYTENANAVLDMKSQGRLQKVI